MRWQETVEGNDKRFIFDRVPVRKDVGPLSAWAFKEYNTHSDRLRFFDEPQFPEQRFLRSHTENLRPIHEILWAGDHRGPYVARGGDIVEVGVAGGNFGYALMGWWLWLY